MKLSRFAAATSIALSLGSAAFAQNYNVTKLDANTSGAAEATDPQLVNGWGLSRTSTSDWWVSDNVTGVATLYNGPGAKQSLVVTIPPANPNNKQTPTGTPTGMVPNNSATDFLLANSKAAVFMFATLDGAIAGWNPTNNLQPGQAAPSTHAQTVVALTDGSVYTGLTAATINGKRYLYAANFGKGRVDVFDNAFHRINLSGGIPVLAGVTGLPQFLAPAFTDEQLPSAFVPFGITTIGDDIVVTFVQSVPGQPHPAAGPGKGYVDVFSSDGKLLTRFENGSFLNVPWGVTLAPTDFGTFSHAILVGNFADSGDTENSGTIAAFNPITGKFLGQLQDSTGKPIVIQGIWGLSPGNVSPANLDNNPNVAGFAQVYFSAGPDGETAGLFGYLTAVSTQLTQGSDQ
jgi:uncharacterized protein (TIGR03118 family)